MISVFVFMQWTYVTIIRTNHFPNKTDIALFASLFVSILASVQVTSSSAISSSIKSSNTFSSSLFNFFSCQLPWKGSVRFVFCYLLPVREEATERITTTTKRVFGWKFSWNDSSLSSWEFIKSFPSQIYIVVIAQRNYHLLYWYAAFYDYWITSACMNLHIFCCLFTMNTNIWIVWLSFIWKKL